MSRGGLVRRYPVMAIRDFRLLLAERLIAPASVGFSMVGVSFAVLRATDSPADLSYVLAAQIAPALVFALLGGVAADRFPPQRVIIAANLFIAVGEGTFGLLALTGRPPLWAMIGLESLTGIGVAIFYPASQALLPGIVPGGMLQEASAISRLAMNTGADDRRGRGRPARRGRGPGLGADAVRRRHDRHGADAAVAGASARHDRAPARGRTGGRGSCSPNCARAGRSSARTPGCGSSWPSSAWSDGLVRRRSRCSARWWPGRTSAARPRGARSPRPTRSA